MYLGHRTSQDVIDNFILGNNNLNGCCIAFFRQQACKIIVVQNHRFYCDHAICSIDYCTNKHINNILNNRVLSRQI